MKKIYFLLTALLAVGVSFAQCVINPNLLAGNNGSGIYPDAAHLPNIVEDSLYDQTVQGLIPDSMNETIAGIVSVNVTIDSVRLDSINGLPNGINWVKNPNVLPGGGYGCVEFTGSTTDSAGTYSLQPIGMIWVHLSVPLLSINKDTFEYGNLNRIPPFNNYYVVVDSAPQALSVTAIAQNLCYGTTTGSATAYAAGGSPISPYTYLWNTGATSYTISNVDTGAYSVTVTSGSDTAFTTVTVFAEATPLALVTSADSGSTGNNGVVSVSVSGGEPPYTYRWTNGARSDTATGLAPGTYIVLVRDSLGCTAHDSAIVPNLGVGIMPIAETTPKIGLFPNPANNSINVLIESSHIIPALIEVIDMTGKKVYTTAVSITGHYNQLLNISQFSPGIYTLQMTSGTQILHERFVVTH